MKNIFLGFMVLGLFFTTSIISGQQHMREMKSPEHLKLFKELNLTDQQKDAIEKLRSDHQKEAIDLKASIQKLRIEIKDQLRAKELNENTILSLTKKISDFQAQLKESAVKMWLNAYKHLDDKQKEIWKEKAPMLMENMHDMGGKMGNGKMMQHMKMEH
jgi:hypothetical protein